MSAEIPSRPPFRPDEEEAFRRGEHRHVDEREGDGMQPTVVHRGRVVSMSLVSESPSGPVAEVRPDDAPRYHGRGRAVDFPQTPEQKAAGEEFAQAIMAGEGARYFEEHLSDTDRALLASADAEADPADVPNLDDLGEHPPTLVAVPPQARRVDSGTHRSSSTAGLASIRMGNAMADAMNYALARTEQAVASSLADDGGAIAAFDKGEQSGRALGIREAIRVIERHKAAMKDDPDEYAASILDDIVVELLEAVDRG